MTASQPTVLPNTAAGSVPEADVSMGASVAVEQGGLEEPAAKPQKMTISRIGHFRHFRYPHVDDVDVSMSIEFDFDIFPESVEPDNAYDVEYEEGGYGDHAKSPLRDHAESPLQEEDFKNTEEERLWHPRRACSGSYFTYGVGCHCRSA